MGQKDKCEVRLLACRIFLNSGCVYIFIHLLRPDIGNAKYSVYLTVYLTHTQLAAYLNFFEIVELLNLKKKL